MCSFATREPTDLSCMRTPLIAAHKKSAISGVSPTVVLCALSVCLTLLTFSSARAAGPQEQPQPQQTQQPKQDEKAASSTFISENVGRGEKIKLEGLVVSRQGDILTVRGSDSNPVKVELTDYTQIATRHGLFGKKHMSASELAAGLWVKVKGVGDSPGHVLAESISFSGDDLRTARAIQAGLTPLDTRVQAGEQQIKKNTQDIQANGQQIQANQQQIQTSQKQIEANKQEIGETNQRISQIEDYELKYSSSIIFPVGSAILSSEAKGELMRLANDANELKGYVFQVKGFTDSSGSVETNQVLSMRRAESVIAYLEQFGNVPLTRVLTPGAMGDSHPVSSNDTPEGRAENRRVEVKVLVSRGLATAQ
jgi:OmpA-OmpF porin, OOP family